ncbi:MAG: cell division protein FtsL [Acidobacteria bacterium]|nr:cell division protein FtsL [Acidobacteriota bacterium]MBI3263149.1 cell division protein FtsL [Acidobacteriota bacterium]
MDAIEYSLKKSVRNAEVVRELDEARQRELWRSVAIGMLLVALVLVTAWQHFELLQHGYRLEQMQQERGAEEEINRHLRLEIDTLRAPGRIETLAVERLHLVAPGPNDAIVVERVAPAEPPPKSVIASR